MSRRPPDDRAEVPGSDTDPREVWALLCELVLDNVRRREVSATLGMSFGRIRAIRRIARCPMSMGELAVSLGIDPPNATTLVDELEGLGLARRQPHPTDRRAKVVEATRKGRDIARRADEILSTPPVSVSRLDPDDIRELYRILRSVTGGGDTEGTEAGQRTGRQLRDSQHPATGR